MTERARLLFVSYCFAPVLTPEAIQNGRTLRALHELGWDVTVLTVDERTSRGARDLSLLEVLPEGVRIVRAPSMEGPFRALRGAPIRALEAAGFPELYSFWYPQAVRAGLRLLGSERFDAMHSWSSFQTSNLVGLRLRRASGLPWVVHFSDPWVDSPYYRGTAPHRAIARRLERAVIGACDGAVFITEETRDLVMRKYPPAWSSKATVIAHGYLREQVRGEPPPRADGELRLVHTGSFYWRMREPLSLLAALALIARDTPLEGKLRMVFVGPTLPQYVDAARRGGLDRVVEWQGPRGFAETQGEAERADALVVIDADADVSVFLPSKLADYLAARRPILGLTPARGATAALLGRLGCPVVPPHDVEAIAGAIRGLLARRAAGPLRVDERYERTAAGYEIRTLTGSLDAMLRQAVSAGRRAAPST